MALSLYFFIRERRNLLNLKTRLDRMEKTLKVMEPETIVIIQDKEECILHACCSMQGTENKRLRNRLEKCSATKEIKEAVKGTKTHLIVIKSKSA